MRKLTYFLALYCALCVGQQNGKIISTTEITFPKYVEIPGIEMYYDKKTYDEAVTDNEAIVEKILYYSDGLKVVAYLGRPNQPGKEALPVIIFNRGSGVRNDIAYVHAPLFKKLVHAGFLVIAPALRGSEGGEGVDEMGGNELNDIKNILPVIEKIPNSDTSHMFMLGESRGGIMTYMALRDKFPVRAAVVIGGITDMAYYLKGRPWEEKFFQERFNNYEQDKDSILNTRSALAWVEAFDAPLLIMNGQADPQVVPTHALKMAQKLAELGKVYELIIMEGGNHILSGENTERRDKEVIRWFKKYIN